MDNSYVILQWVFAVNLGTLITIIVISIKALRFVNRMEFKVDLMWDDYEARMKQYRHARQQNGISINRNKH